MLVVTGLIEVAEESRNDFIRHASEMAKTTRTESGCNAYAFFQDIEDPNRFRIYEEWENEAALEAHFKTDHMAEYRAVSQTLEISSVHIDKFESGDRVRIR
jgi:quinol monooxygenase YgiN